MVSAGFLETIILTLTQTGTLWFWTIVSARTLGHCAAESCHVLSALCSFSSVFSPVCGGCAGPWQGDIFIFTVDGSIVSGTGVLLR